MNQQQQEQQDTHTREANAAARAHDAARQARIAIEEKCLLGLITATSERRSA